MCLCSIQTQLFAVTKLVTWLFHVYYLWTSLCSILGYFTFIIYVCVRVLYRPDLSRLPSWPNWSDVMRRFESFQTKREPPSGAATPPRIIGPLDPGFNNPLYNAAPFDDANVSTYINDNDYLLII